MRLDEYIEKYEKSVQDFVYKVKLPPTTIYRYMAGRQPRPKFAKMIVEATGGKVTMEDFGYEPIYKGFYKTKRRQNTELPPGGAA